MRAHFVEVTPPSLDCRSRRPDDATHRLRMRELAAARRLYREGGLAVRKRGGRKRALGVPAPIALPAALDHPWSMDFVSDSFSDGRRFRMLAVVDDFTRECLALVADTSFSDAWVAGELDAAIVRRGRALT